MPKPIQNLTKSMFVFVHDVDLMEEWKDEKGYPLSAGGLPCGNKPDNGISAPLKQSTTTGITYAVGSSTGICFDGTNIWVANSGSNNVTKLRASDGTILGTYTVGTNPLGICFDGTNIWVANEDSNNVTKLRASDGPSWVPMRWAPSHGPSALTVPISGWLTLAATTSPS